MLHLTLSLRALVFVLLLAAMALTGSDVARGAPSAIIQTGDNHIQFQTGGQDVPHDINVIDNLGGLRFFGCPALDVNPQCAAIQFFGNQSSGFPGQLFLDAGKTNTGAIIFRTATTSPDIPITERMRVAADGNVGIGTATPNEQLELTGNLRLPATTATTGILRSGSNTLLHTFGVNNFFAGINAGNLTMTGIDNTATGQQALQSNTTGSFNTAAGANALFSNTTGSANTATGASALLNNTTGSANMAAGQGALFSNTTGLGNTAVGTSPGITNTIGSNNTFLGRNADAASNNLTNATAVGFNAQVGASDSLVLGGTGDDAVNVGIGTTTPLSTLQVVGNYIQFPTITGSAPPAADCNEATEAGRLVVRTDGATNLYICSGATWIGK
jgi:hypothetical protein